MQDIMSAIIANLNMLNKQYSDVESELDYLYLEGDPVAILEELESIQVELDKTSFVNCTPHTVTIEGIGDLPPSGILPRVTTEYTDGLPLNGVRDRQQVIGLSAVTGLPDPVEGITFIVSGMVRGALIALSRPDVFAPDTGSDAIINNKGHIVSVSDLFQ